MTKKRIADLLKEEVEKPADADSAAPPSKASSAAKKSSSATTAKAKASGEAKSRTRKRASAATATKASAAKSAAAKAASADSKPAALKPAASDKKVAELEAALAKSAAQVSALQEDVDTHQERIFELKDSLKSTQSEGKKKDAQLEKLAAELEEAKQTILKLTAANKEKETVAIAQKSAAAEAAKAAEEETKKADAKPAERQISVYRRPYTSYKSIPEYAIQRGTPASGQNNSMMDDDDIGWVD